MEGVGVFSGHLVNFLAIWYIFHPFGILYQEKSGNHGCAYFSLPFKRPLADIPL
jgi:hypothetical protein